MSRISILLPNLVGGGVERIRIILAHEFVRAGHEVEFVLAEAKGQLLEEAQDSFSVIDLDVARMRNVPVALVRYLRDRRPHALLAAMWPLTVIAPLAQRISGVRCSVIVSEHGILSAQYRDWGRAHRLMLRLSTGFGYRLADRCVGVSTGVAVDMAELAKMRKDSFDVIYNPIPPHLDPNSVILDKIDQLWSEPRGARILTVGTMKAVKNHPFLLRAFARLDRPDARLMFVGDGVGREALLKLAHELGVADRIILAGFHPDPTPFYKTADLFVLSSNFEGFGNVIVEALACGTPVVSTDCPSGPREILDGGQYGRLVPVGDVHELAQSINSALNTKHDRAALIRRADDFEPQIAANKYLNLLRLT